MSNRQDKEREAELQPKRMQFACEAIASLGYPITYLDETRLEFEFKGEKVKLFPYSGWHTGKSIQDGRGLQKLLNQLK
jgi:hypothetical protein